MRERLDEVKERVSDAVCVLPGARERSARSEFSNSFVAACACVRLQGALVCLCLQNSGHDSALV